MSALVARLLDFQRELAIELQRFVLLWRYQHPVLALTLWLRLSLKRTADLLLGLLGLLAVLPLMGVVAILVRLDSRGPIFYAQERMGRFGEPFRIYKFRTMRVDAESAGPRWSAGDEDPRMTPLGCILRRTHIDELPQLWNVVKGEMSLVGPRPERPVFVEQLNRAVPRYDERLLVRPGITGLAQVHYRYDQTVDDVKRKLRFDLLYVKRMCVALDLRILAWTCLVVMTGRGIR